MSQPRLVPISITETELKWFRGPERARTFELRSGDQAVATLRWEHAVGSLAHGAATDGYWTFKRGGFLSPHVSAWEGDSAARETARMRVHWVRCEIDWPGHGRFSLARTGTWIPAWDLQDANGTLLAHMEPVREGRHLEGGLVPLSPAGARTPGLGLLLVLAWYFVALSWFEDELSEIPRATLARLG